MAQYGIELYADTGFKFIIPDYSGFVFSHYLDFTLPAKTWSDAVFHSQAIPSGAQVAVFVRVLSKNPGNITNAPTVMYQNLGTQLNFSYIHTYPGDDSWHTVSIRLYFFYNKETTPDNSSYGLRVYDENGVPVFHTSSKPLRIQRANWGYVDGWSADLGHGVAVLCNRLGQRGVIDSGGYFKTHILNIIPEGWGTTLAARLSYQHTIPAEVYVNNNTNPEIMYINTNYYD